MTSTINNSISSKSKQTNSKVTTDLINVISLLSPRDMIKQCESENLKSAFALLTEIKEIVNLNTNMLEKAIDILRVI